MDIVVAHSSEMEEVRRQSLTDDAVTGLIYKDGGHYRVNYEGRFFTKRRLLSERQDGRCFFCGDSVNWKSPNAHMVHLVPKRLGGTGEQDNRALTCQSCGRRHQANPEGLILATTSNWVLVQEPQRGKSGVIFLRVIQRKAHKK